MTLPDVTVLVPAHDEAGRIAATVTAALAVPGVVRVVVADDGSSDDTARVASSSGADVVRLERNVGKGAALDAALDRVRDSADVLLMLDGDLAETASQGALILRPVLDGEADMAVATFPAPPAKAGFGLVMGLARAGIRALGGPAARDFPARAPVSGQRAMTKECWERVTPFAFGYGADMALTVRAFRAGLRVVEVPTTMAHAATGRDVAGFAHRGRQFAHIALALVRLVFERPRRGPSASG